MVVNFVLFCSEVIKCGMYVMFCLSDLSMVCIVMDWFVGYIVFVDLDGDGSFDMGSDIIFRVNGWL